MLSCYVKNNIRSFFKIPSSTLCLIFNNRFYKFQSFSYAKLTYLNIRIQKLRAIKPSFEIIYSADSGRYICWIVYTRYVIPAILIDNVPYTYYPSNVVSNIFLFPSPSTMQLRNPTSNIQNL